MITSLKTSHAADIDERLFTTVLEKLQRWDAKNAGHQSEKRRGGRHGYENQGVVLVIPAADYQGETAPSLSDPAHISFIVRARNLSRTGLSFLTTRDVLPRVITDDSLPIYVDELLKIDRTVFVALEKDGGELIWVVGKVVRFRSSHDSLFECGIQFLAKALPPAL